jgi:pantothenate kinase
LVFEGNYLSLDKEPWREAAGLMDELWFVDVDFELARQRLVPRHVKAGIARNEKEAEKRIRENDLVNGQEIVSGRMEVHEFIISKEDERLKPVPSGVIDNGVGENALTAAANGTVV